MSAESPAVKALFGCLVSSVKAVKAAMANGWDTATDAPELGKVVLQDILVVIDQGPKAVAEAKAAPFAAIQVAIAGLIEIVDLLK